MSIEHRAIEKPPPCPRSAPWNEQILGRKQHDVELAKITGNWSYCLAIQTNSARFRGNNQLVCTGELIPLDTRVKMRLGSVERDQLGKPLGSKRAQRADDENRFEQVRFALTVIAEKYVEMLSRR